MTPDPRPAKRPQFLHDIGVRSAVWYRPNPWTAYLAEVIGPAQFDSDGDTVAAVHVLEGARVHKRIVDVKCLTPRAHRFRGCGAKNARGALPASNVDRVAECARFHGKTLQHRITGQVREVTVSADHVNFAQHAPTHKWIDERSHRKALQWLRNAEVVA